MRQRLRQHLPAARVNDAGLLLVDAIAEGNTAALVRRLRALGGVGITSYGRIVSGWVPLGSLDALAPSAELRFARPAYQALAVGRTTSQGDIALAAADARSNTGTTGSGVIVGTLSDSYDCLSGAATDIANGDLPADIQVLQDATAFGCPSVTDEGRAMMQIIHDLAPQAPLAFNTAYGGTAGFANGIRNLVLVAGAQVVVDDVIYLAEPMFQDGPIAQAADTVVGLGAAYFSAAGNFARQSYESAFRDSGITGLLPHSARHNFSTSATDTLQSITIPVGGTATFILQWDQPFYSVSGAPGASSDLDLVLYNSSNQAVAATSTNNIGGDAVEVLQVMNPGPGTAFGLSIQLVRGPAPGLVKYIYAGNVTINNYSTNSSTLFGHANAAGARAVAAAWYTRTPAYGVSPPQLEAYSALGRTSILYDTSGNRANVTRLKPEITAADGVDTTFFGTDTDGDGFPNFFGTSAAAPHAAAIAALLIEHAPGSTPAQVYGALQDTTLPMSSVSLDSRSGTGLLQAASAMSAIAPASGYSLLGFTTLPDGTPVNGSFAEDAYATTGVTVSVSGRSDGLVGVSAGASGALTSGFSGGSILASGTAGSTYVIFTFSPSVMQAQFAFASASGLADVEVLGPGGVSLMRNTLSGAETLTFGGETRLAGAASVTGLGAISQIIVRAVGTDTDLRVDSLSTSTSPAPAADAVAGEAPLPLWADVALAGLLLLGARRAVRVRRTLPLQDALRR